ncbi:hypothetical protein HYD46_02690 [Mycoplasmopsis bovis]|nr:hypothetical protein [Mycoplasmopsis bovis]QQH78117.1 hypothetical protein HYD46_02690 [Mycoplasmopsis bovis]
MADEKNSSETMNDKQKQDSGTNSDQKDQDSKTNGSSNEPIRPSESAQSDMQIENSEINTYLDEFNEYVKETSIIKEKRRDTEKAKELLKKNAKIVKKVKKLFSIYHENLKSGLEKIKKLIEKDIKNPGSENY